jgi:hypothetical protein
MNCFDSHAASAGGSDKVQFQLGVHIVAIDFELTVFLH